MFMASSASSAAAAIDLVSPGIRARLFTRIFGTIGRVAEIAASKKVERSASVIPKVGEPFREGRGANLWKAAGRLTAASLVVSLVPGHRRRMTLVSGLLGLAGSLCLRFAVHYITNVSARDPRASFHQQRSARA
jgi:hypothetical protein